jgi:hypothetical protein
LSLVEEALDGPGTDGVGAAQAVIHAVKHRHGARQWDEGWERLCHDTWGVAEGGQQLGLHRDRGRGGGGEEEGRGKARRGMLRVGMLLRLDMLRLGLLRLGLLLDVCDAGLRMAGQLTMRPLVLLVLDVGVGVVAGVGVRAAVARAVVRVDGGLRAAPAAVAAASASLVQAGRAARG